MSDGEGRRYGGGGHSNTKPRTRQSHQQGNDEKKTKCHYLLLFRMTNAPGLRRLSHVACHGLPIVGKIPGNITVLYLFSESMKGRVGPRALKISPKWLQYQGHSCSKEVLRERLPKGADPRTHASRKLNVRFTIENKTMSDEFCDCTKYSRFQWSSTNSGTCQTGFGPGDV